MASFARKRGRVSPSPSPSPLSHPPEHKRKRKDVIPDSEVEEEPSTEDEERENHLRSGLINDDRSLTPKPSEFAMKIESRDKDSSEREDSLGVISVEPCENTKPEIRTKPPGRRLLRGHGPRFHERKDKRVKIIAEAEIRDNSPPAVQREGVADYLKSNASQSSIDYSIPREQTIKDLERILLVRRDELRVFENALRLLQK